MQQQPLEEGVASLETSGERHAQSIARMDAMIEDHDQLIERLVANQEFLQENLKTLQASQQRMEANHEAIVSLLEELTRDAANTRRLWLHLAQRYGWIDDEQNGAQPETPT